MNTEYIRSNEIKYLYSNNGHSVPDIQICTEYMPNIHQTIPEYAPNIYLSSQFDRTNIKYICTENNKYLNTKYSTYNLRIFE
jgi:hypothetical protein